MPNLTRRRPKNVEDKSESTSDETSKATTANEKVEDDDANKQVEQKTVTDVANKKSPAIVNLAADLSKFSFYINFFIIL